jgi:hypothetical protein
MDLFDNIDLRKRLRYQQRLREGLRKPFRLEYQGQSVQGREMGEGIGISN